MSRAPVQAEGTTIVAINVGGALLPLMLSVYVFARSRLRIRMLIGVVIGAAIVHSLAQIEPGVGIAVPMALPPLAAAVVALTLAGRRGPSLAYVSGSMGALIGADILNLSRIAELGAPVVSIGGAGTFDGVFLTGLIAGVLAMTAGPYRDATPSPPVTSTPTATASRGSEGGSAPCPARCQPRYQPPCQCHQNGRGRRRPGLAPRRGRRPAPVTRGFFARLKD